MVQRRWTALVYSMSLPESMVLVMFKHAAEVWGESFVSIVDDIVRSLLPGFE